MTRSGFYLTLFFCGLSWAVFAQQPTHNTSKTVLLPNGWSLSPAGTGLLLGDLPLNIQISPNGKYLAATNNGQSTQSIQLVDLKSQQLIDTKEVGKAWLGLAFSDDSKTLYAAGGNDNWVLKYAVSNRHLQLLDTIVIGKPGAANISLAGLALDDNRHLLYVVTKEDNSVYVVDLASNKIIKQLPIGAEGYTCILSPDKQQLFVTCWGCNKVLTMDTKTLEWKNSIAVGSDPNEVIVNKKGTVLYVANANDNSVSVIDLKQQKVIETLNAALYPNSPSGSTTNGLALSDNNKTLYIANADNNCLAVYDVSVPGKSKNKGFIPTGWYPTCVRVAGNSIYVANGKGFSSLPNPKGPNPMHKKEKVTYQQGEAVKPEVVQYIGGLFTGTLSTIAQPTAEQLAVYTKQVYANTPYNTAKNTDVTGLEGNPIPKHVGDVSPIKYVFYIIKENRTYDQILGDVKEGNGDTSLVLFGEKVTPNQHALAHQFVLLDNFYVNGEVSADGHSWSTGAYANDYLEKIWPTYYGGRGGSYSSEGQREIANNKNGFIWDICHRYGVSYRTYGEFADNYKPSIPVLKDHFCTYYTSFDQTLMDTTRFYQWKRDFDSLMAINQVPRFNSLRMINDHTEGLKLNRPTPIAHVADNDLAVGMFVDYLSKSSIWNESVVFILEDDAQNGPDHVDAHRSPVYVAGGFVKRGYVDHTMYSTASVLRTIELILGLPPMSQYDAAAEPMWRCFNNAVDSSTFNVTGAKVDLFEVNVALNDWQRKSQKFNFKKEDQVPDRDLNEVIWVAVKGTESVCPAPKHAAFVKVGNHDEDDE